MHISSLIIALLLGLVSTSVTAQKTVTPQPETITVGFFPEDYPPLYWHQNQQGIIQQILALMAERSHFHFEPRFYPFSRLINNVANGSLDLEPWTSPAWRQSVKDQVYFTEPFTQHCEAMIFPKEKAFNINTPDDLQGKKVGTVQNFTFPSYTHLFQSKKIFRVSANNEEGVLNMLKHGRSELAFMDEMVANYLMKTQFKGLFEIAHSFDCVPIVFMFNKSKIKQGKAINALLQTLKKEKVIENIKNKYRL